MSSISSLGRCILRLQLLACVADEVDITFVIFVTIYSLAIAGKQLSLRCASLYSREERCFSHRRE
jgi:hypothetical protein